MLNPFWDHPHQCIFFFKNFHDAPKVAISYKRTKSGYKTNKEIKNLRILLHDDKPIEPTN
jgi:hypothetical protein